MTIYQRIAREPALLLAVVVATTGVLVEFGVPLTDQQSGKILVLVGAVLALLRFVMTPASEVVVQQRPDGGPIAGPASEVTTGQPVVVDVTAVPTLDDLLPPVDDAGGRVSLTVVVGASVVLALVVLVGLVLFRVI